MTTVLLSLGSNLRPHYHLHAAVGVLRTRFGEAETPEEQRADPKASAVH